MQGGFFGGNSPGCKSPRESFKEGIFRAQLSTGDLSCPSNCKLFVQFYQCTLRVTSWVKIDK